MKNEPDPAKTLFHILYASRALFGIPLIVVVTLTSIAVWKNSNRGKEKESQKNIELTQENAEAFVLDFYKALCNKDYETVYKAVFPEDKIDYIKQQYASRYRVNSFSVKQLKNALKVECEGELKGLFDNPKVESAKCILYVDTTDFWAEYANLWSAYSDGRYHAKPAPDDMAEQIKAETMQRLESAGVEVSKENICVAVINISGPTQYFTACVYKYNGRLYIGGIRATDWFTHL